MTLNDLSENTENVLVIPQTIVNLLDYKEKIYSKINKVTSLIDEIRGLINKADIDFHYTPEERKSKQETQIENLDYSFWVRAFEMLHLTDVMSHNARDKFLKGVETDKLSFNIQNTKALEQNAIGIFKENSLNIVKEVFKQLIGADYSPSWNKKKTNNLQKIEQIFRVNSTDFFPKTYNRQGFDYYPSKGHGLHLNDLLTACYLLDGRYIPNYSNNFYAISHDQLKDGGDTIVTEYFTVKAYKNGNNKFNWNENKLDVLDKLNAFGVSDGHVLPDIMKKRYKPEHFNTDIPFKVAFEVPHDYQLNCKNDYGYFPTPDNIVKRMIELADIKEDSICLEPSAGLGNIAKYLNPELNSTTLIEIDGDRHKKLIGQFPECYCINEDFLMWPFKSEYFDRIVMNPPFNEQIEACHIWKAWGLLKRDGVLVSIVPEGWFFIQNSKAKTFRRFLEENNYYSEKVSGEGFKESGTMISTRIIILKKEKV